MLLLWILGAAFAETLVALTGQVAVFIFSEKIKKYIQYFISFAVGTMLAVVFLNIIPEAAKFTPIDDLLIFVLAGFLLFFLFSRFIFWFHCHTSGCPIHERSSGAKVLAGDAIHNFIDGIVIALAFLADFKLGIITSIAVLAHEAPMEMSDFFILLHAGYSRGKALFFNFLVAITTPIGAVLTYFAASNFQYLIAPALGLVAGNFLYIAASDLIPELHESYRKGTITNLLQFSLIVLGILIIYAISLAFPE